MSIDARIYLDGHANPKRVFDVIQKIVGVEFQYKSFNNDPFDENEPTGKNNSWHLKPVKNENEIVNKDIDYLTFEFQDLCNNHYLGMYHLYLEDDTHALNNEKCMNPNSTPVWLAIGKRLVDFFGGKMMFADCSDDSDPKNWYIGKSAKYGPKNKESDANDGDSRWYQFFNALNTESMLTAKEIKDMIPNSAYPNEERTEHLLSYLDKYETAKQLSGDLKKKKKSETKKMKV